MGHNPTLLPLMSSRRSGTRRKLGNLCLGSACSVALTLGLSSATFAQVEITDDQTTTVRTSSAGADGGPSDVVIGSDANIEPAVGPGVVLDSDNALNLAGDVIITDRDDAVGVELQGGANRSYVQSGSIRVDETYEPTDTDDDPFLDGPDAEGTGRTGILISGASPFQGNIELEAGSSIIVEGNNSTAFSLANTPMMMDGLTGNLTTAGSISVIGDNSTAVNLASNITGNVENSGSVTARGTDSGAYNIDADIQGGFTNVGALQANAFRFTDRPPFSTVSGRTGRQDLDAEDLNTAGSALAINGNISRGILLDQRIIDVVDSTGATVQRTIASSITQTGPSAAVLIDGNGTPIAVGVVAEITDVTAEGYDETLQYAFINQGSITSNGLYDDFSSTALQTNDVTFAGGISNSGAMSVSTFRSPTELDSDRGEGVATVIILGGGTIADEINNSGLIIATARESADEVYADDENIPAPRAITAIGIDVAAGASVSELINSGSISSILIGREGQAVALRDASGTLLSIQNTGNITAVGQTSDPNDNVEIDLSLVAIDVSANTSGFTLVQSLREDLDLDDGIDAVAPVILGDVLMGAGDDTLMASSGVIVGDVDFAGGTNALSLSGGTTLTGDLRTTGTLSIDVATGSTLALASATEREVTSASFDGTSTFRPVFDGSDGSASTLTSGGEITFEAGASVSPILQNIVGSPTNTYSVASAGNLTVGDLATLSAGATPFLFNSTYALDPNDPNTLVVTLDLRDPTLSVEQGGLGIDSVQQSAYNAVIETLSFQNDLGNAFAAITEGGDFYNAYNQILPEFGAAAKQFIMANVDGATGAVGSHLDTARRSPEKPGGAWLQEFAYFADRELAGLSEQYRGAGFGFTGGLDTAIGPFHAVGVSLGFASTDIEDVLGIDEPLDIVTYQAGVYAGFETGRLGVDAYVGGGFNDFEQNRRVRVNEFFGTASADRKATHINSSIRAGYDVELSEKFWIRPEVSFDYLRLTEDAYRETGNVGVALDVDKRTSETGSVTAMMNLGAKFQGRRTWIRPSVRAGYRQELLNDPLSTSFRFTGLSDGVGGTFDSQTAQLQSLLFPDSGFILGFSIAAGSQYSSIGFDFDSDIRDGFIRHTGRIVVRLLF